MTRFTSIGVALLCIVSAAACQSREERVQERLTTFEAEARRYSWSCDAMGVALEDWLDIHEEELRDDAHEIADHARTLHAPEREEYLAEIRATPNPEAHEALADCSSHAGVQTALARLADIMQPITVLERPPSEQRDEE